MALTSSHPFRLAAAESHRKHTRFVVHAKKEPPFSFQFGKRGGGDNGSPQTNGGEKQQTSRFIFDFNGKLPDVRKQLAPVVSSSPKSLFGPGQRRKDPNTVFVAGASGQAGVRISRELLRKGFAVRAGVLDLAAAQELAQLALKYKLISPEESRRLNAVESPVSDAEAIARSIGNASKVVVTVGRGENGPTGEVTAEIALEVVRAAQLSGARHVALVYDTTSTGFGAGGSTYNVLDGLTTFFSNLFSPTQPLTFLDLLSKIAEIDINCTVLKASLTDDYAVAEGGCGIAVAAEGSGGSSTATSDVSKVSKSQIASLIADIFSNVEAAENRVVEVSTSSSATSKTVEELFSGIPEDRRRKAYLEEQEKAKELALIASEEARKAAEAAAEVEEEVQTVPLRQARPSKTVKEVSKKVEVASLPSINGDSLREAVKGLNIDFSWEKLGAQLQAVAKITKAKPEEEELKVQVATARGQAKARALTPRKAVVKPPPPPKRAGIAPAKKLVQTAAPKRETEVRKVFGGLFKQETIYIDDD